MNQTNLFCDETTEQNALAVSSFIRKNVLDFREGTYLTAHAPVLKSLGIPFKQINGKNFWLANEGNLEYIYNDFCKLSKQALVELHPDRGGDGEEFGVFAKTIVQIKNAFHKKGIGVNALSKARNIEEHAERKKAIPKEFKRPVTHRIKRKKNKPELPFISTEVIIIPKESGIKKIGKALQVIKMLQDGEQIKDIKQQVGISSDLIKSAERYADVPLKEFRDKKKAAKVIILIKQGIPIALICRKLKCASKFVRKVANICFESLPLCQCGRRLFHEGPCSVFFKRDRSKMSGWLKGKPLSEEHKRKIGDAKKGKKMSKVTCRRMAFASTMRRRNQKGIFLSNK